MDDTSGPALAERLRRHHPGALALYLAQSGTPESENVLVRPFTRDDLVARLGALSAAATSRAARRSRPGRNGLLSTSESSPTTG